jgi:hypothetical protein
MKYNRTGLLQLKILVPCAIFGVLTFLTVHGQQAAANGATADDTPTGKINGRVVNEAGQPLANAGVSLRAFGASLGGRTIIADAEGNFEFNDLDSALYSISASMPAYTMEPGTGDLQSNLHRLGESVKLTLIKGGVLTGTVTNSSGEPVIAVPVRARLIKDAEGKPPRFTGTEFPARTTDDRGIYRIYGLAPGVYVVYAGGASSSFGFRIGPYDQDVPTYAPSSTRDTATEISVRSGDEITGVDIRYRGEQGHLVSGRAAGTFPANTPGAFNVTMTALLGGKPQWSTNTIQPPNGNGFAFSGVADGEYELWSNSFFNGEGGISEPRRVTVKGANVTGIELVTKPLASVAGRLTFETSTVEDCRDKRRPQLAETLVYTDREEKPVELMFERNVLAIASPTRDGSFRLGSLAPGQYSFSTRFFAKYWYLDSISIGPPAGSKALVIDAAKNWTTLKLGDRLTGLNIKLAEGAASLRGKTARPVTEALVFYLVPADREKSGDALRYYGVRINSDGTFALNNLAPGRYLALVRSAAEKEPLTKLHRPDQSELRAQLKREADVAKQSIEFKPCENKINFEWTTPAPQSGPAKP